ncbi:hypothetical protein NQ314_016510 [Rhamnusium bicolor]|uniref:Uncharacterized protein n=1 Tax=Rhamnusium bicolor TaxID=1586634 RepID=A0AAV8WVG6_9CUCU|nr:hypothetical protein NQ314_016510 [Rhamnusium bicolor]
MAEDDLPSNVFANNQRENNPDSELPQHLRLDLGDDSSRNPEINRLGNQNAGAAGSSSLVVKFLKQSNQELFLSFSSALPDFVQDHLVIEQCYLGNNPNNYNLDINNLPDFTQSRDTRSKFDDDLNGRDPVHNSNKPIPLDLPIRPQGAFPLDLPIGNPSSGSRNGPTVSEVGNSKSLPDFLADSAVCSQKGDTLSVPHSPESESERLRHELDIMRRQLTEQTRLCECLSRELELARNKEHEYTQNIARALEQIESITFSL